MGPEADFLAKYAPYYVPILSAILLIIFTKNYLFRGTISADMYREQLAREKDFVAATKEAAGHLDEISRQLENITKKQSEDVRVQTENIRDLLEDVKERLRTLELVFSDNIDAIRHLASQCEKHRKNIPDTGDFRSKKV